MEPVLQKLGDVTIQRLPKPKEPPVVAPQNVIRNTIEKVQETRNITENFQESKEEDSGSEPDSGDDNEIFPSLKRSLPDNSEVSIKKFKFDPGSSKEKIGESKQIDDGEDILSKINNFSETDMSEYDTESDIESESEMNNELNPILEKPTINTEAPVDPTVKEETPEDDEASSGTSFFEKLVEQAEIEPAPSITPKSEPPDEDYEIDIKEKLKEMGEISFATVKKGDKKKTDSTSENEVVITPTNKKSEDEVTVTSKGNLRRNIREVMDETKLDEATLAAQRQEAERLRRVQEQQRLVREFQRQAQQERMQAKVMSLLQGNNFPRPATSRIGNTVLVKLPNGQTKPISKVQKRQFDLLKMPGSDALASPPLPPPLGGAPRAQIRGSSMSSKKPGSHLTPSVSIAPVSKKMMPPMMEKPHSDSDSESEDRKPMFSPPPRGKSKDPPVATIDISSDDDCIVVSEPEGDGDDSDQDDPSNSGMHTNDEFNQPDEQGRVLVNVAHAEDEPDVFVAPQIARIIKPHQIGGVRFLYDNLVESINRFESSTGFGCILAHSMGLGKTLQIVTFSDIFLRYTPARTVLCIMPINTLQNWLAEFNMWLPLAEAAPNNPLNAHGEVRPRNFNLYVLNDSHKTLVARSKVIHAWRTGGGVLLIGYEQYRLLSLRKCPKSRRKGAQVEGMLDDKNKLLFDEIYESLVCPGPDLVICDEGHRIKNSHASISQALKQMRTKRRVVLTGYPLQNNLMEYWCMVDFVRPNYLGTKTEFCNMFERPIMNGQCIDSTENDIKLMRYRAHVLHSLLVGFVQRRSQTVLHTVLPQKEEYVLLVRMTPFQRKLYDTFMNEVVRVQAVPNPLKAFAVCCKIWNHPDVLYNFLKKRAGGDAVDIDLEEVGNHVNAAGETKPKRPPPKSRRNTPRGKAAKPAASVTPYISSMESPLQPHPPTTNNISSPVNSQSAMATSSNPGPITSFANAISGNSNNSSRFSQGAPRTSFQGISEEFEDDNISQPYYDQQFDQNAQFPSSFPSSSSNFTQPYQNNPSTSNTNYNKPPSESSYGEQDNSESGTSFLNLDNQTNITETTASSIVNLPSGISLTPLSSKTQSQTPLVPVSISCTKTSQNLPPSNSSLMEIGATTPTKQNNSHFESSSSNNPQFEQNQFQPPPPPQQNNTYNNYEQNNFEEGFNGQNLWGQEQENNGFNPQSELFGDQNNFNSNANHPWIKKEETAMKPSGQIFPPNLLVSPIKSEASNESKPKINIISDIKLPSFISPVKKLNLNDIKLEPKKEEEEKFSVKHEIEKLKNEFKEELKLDDDKIGIDSPLSKLAPLIAMKDSKEDSGIPYEWAFELLKDYVPGRIENSGKMEILFCIIKESIGLGDRLLVFSQSLITLDLIEQFLQSSVIPGDTVNWAKNASYYRLDGSTSALEREKLINEFNSNPKIHLFLVSTRAGSLGINLIGANRVVVLDASWNPCHDTQAVCRVYRYGQRKPCFVYRLVVDNCLEKKIYDRQVSKQGMADRVVDECNPDAHLTIKDVSTLCFDDKKEEREVKDWSEFEDRYIDVVLQKVLHKYGKHLNKEPFQHESLLVDRKEKQLSQQEKRLAKKGYEREKQAARQPSYSIMGSGRGHRPVASVRPMQQGERPSRWIPAEHWQRQGMTAQEMTLPLDVVIPTNHPEKGNIVLKAGQKVLVLKSPKGVYMQLENGKIVAIKTAIKVKGKADDNHDPMKMAKPLMPPIMKNHPSLSVTPQKRPVPNKPFQPGMAKFNMRSIRQNVPNLVSRIQSITKKVQTAKTKPYNVGTEIAKSLHNKDLDPMAGSSEDELPPPPPPHPFENRLQLPLDRIPGIEKTKPPPQEVESADELQKRISMLKRNISIQRVTNNNPQLKKPPLQGKGGPAQPQPVPQKPPPSVTFEDQDKNSSDEESSALEQLEQSTSSVLGDNTPFQETLDSITAGYKNTLGPLDDDEEEEEEEEEEPEDDITDPSLDQGKHDQSEISDQSDDVTYVGEQGASSANPKTDGSQPDYNSSTAPGYNNYYNYNMPPYQPPPPQGYGYPPQHPPYDMMGYPAQPPPHQAPYNYGYQGYPPPPPQPHYPPPPPQPGYDYNNPTAAPPYPGYNPYPQQYPPPPQGMYPPPPASQPPNPYPDYSQQYGNAAPPPAAPYYPNT